MVAAIEEIIAVSADGRNLLTLRVTCTPMLERRRAVIHGEEIVGMWCATSGRPPIGMC